MHRFVVCAGWIAAAATVARKTSAPCTVAAYVLSAMDMAAPDGGSASGRWMCEEERPDGWKMRWDNIPLGLLSLGLFVGGPLMKMGAGGPAAFLQRRPLKAARGNLAKMLYIEWATQLTFEEMALVALFAISVLTKFICHYTWFLHVGWPLPAGRAPSHTLGLMMGVTFILPHRSTVILWVTGRPFERADAFHNCTAQAFCWACCLKLVFMLVGYEGTDLGMSHLFGMEMDPGTSMYPNAIVRLKPVVPLYGVLIWVTFTLVFITAMDSVRRKMFDLFITVHVPLVVITMVLAVVHSPGAAISWVIIPLFFFWLDKLQFVRDMRCCSSSVLALELLADDACRVQLSRSDAFAYQAGQYIHISFGSLPGGGLQPKPAQIHPYSIVSAPGGGSEFTPGDGSDFTIVIKGMGPGSWSQCVCDLAKSKPDVTSLKVDILGPLGRLQVQLQFFKHVMLFAGGIGVTPLLSIFLDPLNKHRQSPMKKVTLVCAVRDAAQALWFEKAWSTLAESDCCSSGIFTVRQHMTFRAVNQMDAEESGDVKVLEMHTRRPSVSGILQEMKEAYLKDGTGNPGVAVLTCGPAGMQENVHDETYAAQSPECRYSFHTETFLL